MTFEEAKQKINEGKCRYYHCKNCIFSRSNNGLDILCTDLADEEIKLILNEDDVDIVNHPLHYCQEGSIECIDEMVSIFGIEATMSFCLLNVWKYRKRALYKNGDEDMKKSDWYMKKFIELKEKLK